MREVQLDGDPVRVVLAVYSASPAAHRPGHQSMLAPARLTADRGLPPVVITCRDALQAAQRNLIAAGVDLVRVGDGTVDLHAALGMFAERGLRRVDCEGGPTLFGGLISEDLVDALCLTLAPVVVGGLGGRIATHPLPAMPRPMALESVLQAEGSLFVRYRRPRDESGTSGDA